jgi:hypothetical protein
MPPQMAAAVNPERNPQTWLVCVDLLNMNVAEPRTGRIREVYFTAKTGHSLVQVVI